MCYVVHLSTTSPEDLGLSANPLLRFEPPLPEYPNVMEGLLYANKWFINANGRGCSCDLRHMMAANPGVRFGKPESWNPEDENAIAATLVLAATIRRLRAEGHHVDCIDVWAGSSAKPDELSQLNVELASVNDDEFRLFENYHFTFD